VVWLLSAGLLFGLLFAVADGEIEPQDSTKAEAMDDVSPDELLSRAEKASEGIVSVSVTVDHSRRDGPWIETRRTERIHVLSDYYVKSVGPARTEEALFYGGNWYQRNVGGQWTLEEELGAGERRVSIGIGGSDFGTGALKSVLLPRVLVGTDSKFDGFELSRIDDEVVEGRLFLRLRSTFTSSGVVLTGDYWVDAQTFLIYRIKFQGRFQQGANQLRAVDASIEYSRFNQSELPGPLPE